MSIFKSNDISPRKLLKQIAKTNNEAEIYEYILSSAAIEVTLAGIEKIYDELLLKRLALHYARISDGRFRNVIKKIKSEEVACQLCIEATGHAVVHDIAHLLSTESLVKIASNAADSANRTAAAFALPSGVDRDLILVELLKYLIDTKQMQNTIYINAIEGIESQNALMQIALIKDDTAVYSFGNYEMQLAALNRIADDRILYELLKQAQTDAEGYHRIAKSNRHDLSKENKYTFYENAIARICDMHSFDFKQYHSIGHGGFWIGIKLDEDANTVTKAQIIEQFVAKFEALIPTAVVSYNASEAHFKDAVAAAEKSKALSGEQISRIKHQFSQINEYKRAGARARDDSF